VERVGGFDVEHDWDDLFPRRATPENLARVLIVAPRFVVISHLAAGLGADGAGRVLEVFVQRGIGCVALGDGVLTHVGFDAVIDIHATGDWTQTSS
jgi:hypothetical protein